MEEGLPKRSAKRLKTFIGGGSVGCDHQLFGHSFQFSHSLYSGALPYPADISKAIDTVHDSARKLYNMDINSSGGKDDAKRLSKTCFAEVLRCINLLRQLIQALTSLGVVTAANTKKGTSTTTHPTNISMPAYMSLDLGLRQASAHPSFFYVLLTSRFFPCQSYQKRNHFVGRLFFQALLVRDMFLFYFLCTNL